MTRKDAVFRPAGWFWLAVLHGLGAVAIAMPIGRAYFLPSDANDRGTMLHELQHLRQIKRDGRLRFSVKYIYWLLKYGYRANPYEVEAYAREAEFFPRAAPIQPVPKRRPRA